MKRRDSRWCYVILATILSIGVAWWTAFCAAPNPQGVIALYSADFERYVESGETIYYEDNMLTSTNPLPPGSQVFFLEMTAYLVFRNLGTGPLTIFGAATSTSNCTATAPNLPRSIEGQGDENNTVVYAVVEVQGTEPWSATFTFANNSTNQPAFVVTLASKPVLREAVSVLNPTLSVETMEYATMTVTGISVFVLGDVSDCATGEPVQPSGMTKVDIEMVGLTSSVGSLDGGTSLGSLGSEGNSFFDVSFTPDSGTAIVRVPGFEALDIPQLRKLILAFPALWVEVLMPAGPEVCLEPEVPDLSCPDLVGSIASTDCDCSGGEKIWEQVMVGRDRVGNPILEKEFNGYTPVTCDVDLTVTLTNIGSAAAGSSHVSVTDLAHGVSGNASASALGPGESTSVSVDLSFSMDAEDCFINEMLDLELIVDSLDEVAECGEENSFKVEESCRCP